MYIMAYAYDINGSHTYIDFRYLILAGPVALFFFLCTYFLYMAQTNCFV